MELDVFGWFDAGKGNYNTPHKYESSSGESIVTGSKKVADDFINKNYNEGRTVTVSKVDAGFFGLFSGE